MQAAVSRNRQMKSWEPEELQELCEICGLEEYKEDARDRFIFISAKKPSRADR